MRLLVCPLGEVAAVAAVERPSHLISLASPGAPALDPPPALVGERLSLSFHDIAGPAPGLTPPSRDDVAALLAFGAGAVGGVVLVHCWAGVSRSPAAAFVLACQAAPPGAEADLAARLRRAAPYATPNRRIVALADKLLARGGAMDRAIAAIGRGAETSLGRSFLLTDFGAAGPPLG